MCYHSGNFYVKDKTRSDRPITEKVVEIFKKAQQNWHIGTADNVMELGIDQKTF